MDASWGYSGWLARLIALAAVRRHDAAAVERAWNWLFFRGETHRLHVTRSMEPHMTEALHTIRPFSEIPWVSINHIAQWCLNIIECLELIGDQIPEDVLP